MTGTRDIGATNAITRHNQPLPAGHARVGVQLPFPAWLDAGRNDTPPFPSTPLGGIVWVGRSRGCRIVLPNLLAAGSIRSRMTQTGAGLPRMNAPLYIRQALE